MSALMLFSIFLKEASLVHHKPINIPNKIWFFPNMVFLNQTPTHKWIKVNPKSSTSKGTTLLYQVIFGVTFLPDLDFPGSWLHQDTNLFTF